MRLKAITSKPAKIVVIQEGPRKKRTSRPPPVRKGKKVVKKEAESMESLEENPEKSPLKRRRWTVSDMAQQILFVKPEHEPKPSPSPSLRPVQSYTRSTLPIDSLPSIPTNSPPHIPVPPPTSFPTQAGFSQPQPEVSPTHIPTALP